MSFRKRSEIVGGPANNTPGTLPTAVPRGTPSFQRAPIGSTPLVPGRGVGGPLTRDGIHTQRGNTGPGPGPVSFNQRNIAESFSPALQAARTATKEVTELSSILIQHPGIKPSILTSMPCVSTGSNDLDKVLGHQGLPVGTSLLIEENGTTDFATTLLKLYLSQGLIQNRLIPSKQNTHEILVGMDQNWSRSLPGLYKGSSKDRKKQTVKEHESKVSVSNLLDQSEIINHKINNDNSNNNNINNTNTNNNDLKIAWRYGLHKKSNTENENNDNTENTSYPNYNNQFDITTTIIPSPSLNELSIIPINSGLINSLRQIEAVIKRFPKLLIRLVIPSFLNPMFYSINTINSQSEINFFLLGLRNLLRKYNDQLTILISINLDLYPRSNPIISITENLLDSVIELKPFEPALYELMEKVYKKQPTKIKQGHLNIHKLPILSDLGMMCIKNTEYSFKNGKKRFEIEEWSIPVEEEDVDDDTKTSLTSSDTLSTDININAIETKLKQSSLKTVSKPTPQQLEF
ncbi:hypothetical protein B5S31_g1040 [[Candida] boidinii]|nr:hypothetical protein B5S31_g1040 [[Candida] boidinii]OWB76977.1 hypothetical protein B5S32_g1134 [[Candida] boidinii]